MSAKGKSRAGAAYRLLEVSDRASLPRRAGRRSPVGRISFALLEHEFESVVSARRCRLVTVVGEPGVGKSRLVAEFVSRFDGRARVVRGALPLLR